MTNEIYQLCAEGHLRPEVGTAYPLDRAPQALRDLMDRKALGKLVITP